MQCDCFWLRRGENGNVANISSTCRNRVLIASAKLLIFLQFHEHEVVFYVRTKRTKKREALEVKQKQTHKKICKQWLKKSESQPLIKVYIKPKRQVWQISQEKHPILISSNRSKICSTLYLIVLKKCKMAFSGPFP